MKARQTIVYVLLLLLLASCAGGGLERRAADFYSYMVGQRPNKTILNYISPAFRAYLEQEHGKDEVAQYGNRQKPPGVSKKAPKRSSLRSAVEGSFALTWVEGRPDEPLVGSEPVMWVRDGGRWYLYYGTEAEVTKYSEFPAELKAKVGVPKASDIADKPKPQKQESGK
jgi:hypothetical protein